MSALDPIPAPRRLTRKPKPAHQVTNLDVMITRILRHPSISRYAANNARGVYCVWLGPLKTGVLILLTPSVEKYGYYDIKISHTIKTPLQGDAGSRQKWRRGRTQTDALRRALHDMLVHYREAVNAGHTPGEHWLVWQR